MVIAIGTVYLTKELNYVWQRIFFLYKKKNARGVVMKTESLIKHQCVQTEYGPQTRLWSLEV